MMFKFEMFESEIVGYCWFVLPNVPLFGAFGELKTHYAGDNLNNRFLAITRLTRAQAANT